MQQKIDGVDNARIVIGSEKNRNGKLALNLSAEVSGISGHRTCLSGIIGRITSGTVKRLQKERVAFTTMQWVEIGQEVFQKAEIAMENTAVEAKGNRKHE
jgi:hypothetical protein